MLANGDMVAAAGNRDWPAVAPGVAWSSPPLATCGVSTVAAAAAADEAESTSSTPVL